MGVMEQFPQTRRMALDSSLFIYYIEEHPEYFQVVDSLFQAIALGQIQGVTSQLTLLEVLVHPLRRGLTDLVNRYRAFLTHSRNLTSIPISVEILEKASQLRAAGSLRTPDAIQVATAIVAQADLFVTNDERLIRTPGIAMVTLRSLR